MTVRDIQGHPYDMYGVNVSGGLISAVTDSIQEEVRAWQDGPLEALDAHGEDAAGWQG
jgi:putative transposase